MPPIDKYHDPNSVVRTSIRNTFAGEMEARSNWFDQIQRYYNGDMPAQLDVKEDEVDDNTVINMVKQATDRTVQFLFPSMPKLELDPDVAQETDDEKWLREMWEANGGIQYLQELAYLGCFAGQVYVRVMPADASQGQIYPQLVGLDPKSTQTWWDSSDMRKVIFHEVRWTVVGEIYNIEYMLDFVNNGRTWTIIEYAGVGSLAPGQVTTVGGVWREVRREQWLLPVPPVITWKHLPKTRSFYGSGEYDASMLRLNEAINNVASENNRIIRYHASPKTVGTGMVAGDVQTTSIDGFWAIEDPNAKVYNLEMRSDLVASMSHMQTLVKAFLAECRVVILEGTVKDFQRVTNAGVRTVFIDMLSKLVVLRWNYGKAIEAISRTAAAVGKLGLNVIPTIIYADPLPSDQTEVINVQLLEQQMKIVSRETLATERGRNWANEKAKMTLENADPLFAPPAPAGTGGASASAGGDKKPGLKTEPGSTGNGVKNKA